METLIINVGPLTSYNSLIYHLSSKLKKLRDLYISGSTPEVLLDLSHIDYGSVSISALTGLLTTCKKVRDFLGYPIPTTIKWDPRLQGFLADIDFFKIVDELRLFKWVPEGIVGGYKMGVINPNTKILFYRDINPIREIPLSEIGIEKAKLKQKIAPNFLMRCANLFHGFDNILGDSISNTTLELIVNSLMHAEDIAFVGLQRTKKRITVAVCDGGIGFAKSLARTFPQISHFKNLSHIDAIIIGSLIQKNIHGLRLAINDVLNYDPFNPSFDFNEGWVIISSFDSEIRWQKTNWSRAISYFDKIDIEKNKPDFSNILQEPIKEYVEKYKIYEGYWKKYPEYLVGTRITFEIEL